MKFFFNLFQNYCNENNIIAEFVRFSPWLKTQIGCDYFLDINFWNKVVGIDLRKSKDEIWADFDSKNRNRIRKSIKNGVFIKQDLCFTALDEFYRLYHVTMDRNNALAYYYFDMQFFRNMIQLLANNIAFFHAFLGDTIIASLMVIYAKNYAHAHLACSDTNYLNLAPGNLLFYEVALWAKKSGFKYLFLGGGKNSDPDDSLLRFKKRFSKTYFDFYLGKKIHNKEIYSLLVQKKLQYEKERHVIKIDENFFPQYRRL